MAALPAEGSALAGGIQGDAASGGRPHPRIFSFCRAVTRRALASFFLLIPSMPRGLPRYTRRALIASVVALAAGGFVQGADPSVRALEGLLGSLWTLGAGDELFHLAAVQWGTIFSDHMLAAWLVPTVAACFTQGIGVPFRKAGISGSATAAERGTGAPRGQFLSFLLVRCKRLESYHFRCESFWLRFRGR